jgi:uncharacterized Zn finger protein
VSRENARSKGMRYLGEGRLTVLHVDPERVQAQCRGAGALYRLRWSESEGWTCSCPAKGRCSHLWALLSVTVREDV